MNNNIKNTIRTGLMAVAGVAAMCSCSDTWDDHFNAPATTAFDGTMMQAIDAKSPDFAKIVRSVGYDRELSSENVYTLWLPESVDDVDYWLAQDSATVVDRFIKNHMARKVLSADGTNHENIILMSNKKASMAADGTFNGFDIKTANVTCSNGVMHIISNVNPYSRNLFEEIQEQYKISEIANKDSIPALYTFLTKWNADSLDEARSVYRGVDADGNRIYVDSVTIRNNTQLKNVNALLYREDSSYIAIIPSLEAYQERYNFARKLLNYNPKEDLIQEGRCDSLSNYYAHMFAMTDLYYNKHANEHWQDSLKSTNYKDNTWPYNLYYAKKPAQLHPYKEVNDILSKCGAPVECSNGDAYIVDEYPMSPYEQFFKPIIVDHYAIDRTTDEKGAEKFTKNVNTSFNRKAGSYTLYSVGEDGSQNVLLYETYNFVDIVPSSTTVQPSIAFQVKNNLAGEYDMYVVTSPIWMKNQDFDEMKDRKTYRFNAYVWERSDEGTKIGEYPATGVRLNVPKEDADNPKYAPYMGESTGTTFITTPRYHQIPLTDSTYFEIESCVDTLYLGHYEFKRAYYAGNEEGVLIQLQTQITSKQQTTYSREMLISGFILRPRNSDEGGEVYIPAEQNVRANARKVNNVNVISKITN